MSRTQLLAAGLASLLLVLPLSAVWPLSATEFVVVVHPDNPMESVDKKRLAEIFLKKVTSWPSSETIEPVDLVVEMPVRNTFSIWVHGRSDHAVRAYWQRRLFSGLGVPPIELRSDTEVLEYVRGNTAAIGYVSATADTSGVKTVKLVD